ncbi:PepSY domain-containing protein [Pontixanthobacter sp.]|uniref:PepSY domain-containing protein n=1 Tax=Pontixanthobacter sp. TaxID=2792078 RepID=UPI003C7C24BB
MAAQDWMRHLARWHIWLGWLVGIPIVMWTLSGLVMVARPIEEVRGEHLREPVEKAALPADTNIAIALPEGSDRPVRSVSTMMEGRQPVTTITYMNGAIERFGPEGTQLPLIGEVQARLIVAQRIKGGDAVAGSTFFSADNAPFDFRRPIASWQVELEDGTHVYINQQTGEIAAVRTRWWRIFDFMWGLHIMDISEREDTSHPILIAFAALALTGSIFGCVLMFRRRKARAHA